MNKMQKTEKIYDMDVKQTCFEGTVVECTENEKEHTFMIVLDRTAFFPEEGGQLADTGFINGKPVLDVRIKEDVIYHNMAEPLSIGTVVKGDVDWNRRFDFMQQHSGEHIISGLVHKHYGYDNVGFHLGLREVTMDFNGDLSLRQLREIEAEANQFVWKNLPVQITFPSKEELACLDYRSKIELNGSVRIVEIPGVDICACCAPHVALTGEIGLIKITGVQSHRGGIRVNILCGSRAVEDYTEKQNSVTDISVLLSAKQGEVSTAVSRLKEDLIGQKQAYNVLQGRLLEQQLASLPTPDETCDVTLFTGDMDSIALRNAVNQLTGKYPGYCAVFAGNDTDGYHYIIGSSSRDCRELGGVLRTRLAAKGGGTAPMIQGSVSATSADILVCLQGL